MAQVFKDTILEGLKDFLKVKNQDCYLSVVQINTQQKAIKIENLKMKYCSVLIYADGKKVVVVNVSEEKFYDNFAFTRRIFGLTCDFYRTDDVEVIPFLNSFNSLQKVH